MTGMDDICRNVIRYNYKTDFFPIDTSKIETIWWYTLENREKANGITLSSILCSLLQQELLIKVNIQYRKRVKRELFDDHLFVPSISLINQTPNFIFFFFLIIIYIVYRLLSSEKNILRSEIVAWWETREESSEIYISLSPCRCMNTNIGRAAPPDVYACLIQFATFKWSKQQAAWLSYEMRVTKSMSDQSIWTQL